MGRLTVSIPGVEGEIEVTATEMLEGRRRFYCSNGRSIEWDGAATGWEHTGPCGSLGWMTVPLDDLARWKAHLMADRWSITERAGPNFEGIHQMLFCCGPCQLAYMLREYREPPPGLAAEAAHVRALLNI